MEIFILFFELIRFIFSYYQIRAGIKFAPRIQSATKIEIKSECPLSFGMKYKIEKR